MPINEWSDAILIAALQDEPQFSEDLEHLLQSLRTRGRPLPDVILDLTGVGYLNSSNLSQILRVRKMLLLDGARMRVCGATGPVSDAMRTMGLDRVLVFVDDVTAALTSLQMEPRAEVATDDVDGDPEG
jgi:anti-anti-sigma factor